MFTLAIQRRFAAEHYLTGADWGAENDPHNHDYLLELRFEGESLDRHGFLLDLVNVEREVDDLLAHYREANLNSLPEFEGLNPSLERFARILCAALARRLRSERLKAMSVRLWENESAWASFRLEF